MGTVQPISSFFGQASKANTSSSSGVNLPTASKTNSPQPFFANLGSVHTVAQTQQPQQPQQQSIFQQIGSKASQVIKGIEFHFMQPSQVDVQVHPQAAPAPQPSAGTRMVAAAPVVGKQIQLTQPSQPSLLSEIGNSGVGQKIKSILSSASDAVGQQAQLFMKGQSTPYSTDLYPQTRVNPKTGDLEKIPGAKSEPLAYTLGSALQNPMIAGPEGSAIASVNEGKKIATFIASSFMQSKIIGVLTHGQGSQLSDVVHTNNKSVNAVIDVADLVTLGLLSHGITTKGPEFFDSMTKDVVQKYDLPKTVVIDSQDLRTMNNPATNDFIKTLGLSGEDVKNIRKTATNGTNTQITIQTAQLPQLVDKPYWSTVKDALHLPGTDRTVGQAPAAKVETTSIAGLLKSGENTPQEVLNTVFENKLQNTPEGKAAINVATEAQTSGKNLFVAKNEDQALLRGSDTTLPSSKTSNKSPSDLLAGRTEPSGSTISITKPLSGSEKSINQTLPSNEINAGSRESFVSKFNTNTPLPSHYSKFYAETQAAHPEFIGKTEDLARTTGSNYTARLKELDSIAAKLGRKDTRTLGTVNDAHGSTIVVNDERGLNAAIQAGIDKGIINKDNIDNFNEHPTWMGYRGVHAETQLSNGQLGEIQFHTKDGLYQKSYAHEIYDKWRQYIEDNKDSSFTGVFNKVPVESRRDFVADVKTSRSIYRGEETIPQRVVDKVDSQIKTPKAEIQTAEKPAEQAPSKVATSIQQKAIDQGLTQKFDGLAGYDKITIKDQAEKATATMQDINQARAIIRGEQPLPEGLRGTALITAMEEHIKETGDPKLAYELANSPLVSGTSAAAQELRLAAEREPDSLTAKLQEIKQARMKALEKKTGTTANKAIKDEASKIKNNIKAPDKNDWSAFIQSIQC